MPFRPPTNPDDKKHLLLKTGEIKWCWKCGARVEQDSAPRLLLKTACCGAPRTKEYERALPLLGKGQHPKSSVFVGHPSRISDASGPVASGPRQLVFLSARVVQFSSLPRVYSTRTHRVTCQRRRQKQKHKQTHKRTHKRTQTHTNAHKHTHTHTNTQTRTRPHKNTNTHKQTNRHINKHKQTHKHTQTNMPIDKSAST